MKSYRGGVDMLGMGNRKMDNNPILILVAIFGILWFMFSLLYISGLIRDLKSCRKYKDSFAESYDLLYDNTCKFAELSVNGMQVNDSLLYLEKFKDNPPLQMIVFHYLKLQSENEKLKAHIQLLLNGRD